METGKVVIEKVDGRSLVARCFCKYPLKFIIPRKVGPSQIDAVWIYSISYGGGIVSGDSISCHFTIGDGCTSVLTTQTSTKVYKSVGSNCSEQVLEVLLDQGTSSVVLRMQDYNVIAMIIILGPKLKDIQVRCQEDVKNIMCGRLHGLFGGTNSDHAWAKSSFIASCSSFGPKGREGVIVRVASVTTEAVYGFLRHQLRGMEKFLGVSPYR